MSPLTRVLPSLSVLFAAAGLSFALVLLGTMIEVAGAPLLGLASGLLAALLLRHSRTPWPALLGAAFAGLAAGRFATDASILSSMLLSLGDVVAAVLAAAFFGRRGDYATTLDTLDGMARLAASAMLGALAAAPVALGVLAATGQPAGLGLLLSLVAAQALGILVMVPPLLLSRRPRSESRRTPEVSLILILVLATASWVFTRETSSIFLLTPALVLAGLRLPFRAAALLVPQVCALALATTLTGVGPIGSGSPDPAAQALQLQSFMAAVLMLLLPVAALSGERARAAASLRQSREDYRLLADHGSDLVLRLDGQGEAHFVSSAARRLLGVAESGLLGPALRQRVHEDDLARFDASLDRSMRNGSSVTCFRMRHAGGSYRWVEAHCRLVALDGEATARMAGQHSCAVAAEGRCLPGAEAACAQLPPSATGQRTALSGGHAIVATLRDIDQRRRAELLAAESAARLRESNRLLLMAEGLASLGHWVFDSETREVLLSAEAATLLDLPKLTMSPRDALGLVVAEDRRPLLCQLALARRYDAPVQCTARIERAGETRTLQLRIQQKGAEGELSLFGVISDITDKLRAEQRLVDALEEAHSAAAFRSQFLATMSHEIRTPMTGVIGMIELLGGDPGPAERDIYVDTLRQSADLLMQVLNDILDLSKVDAGQLTFAEEPFDVGRLLLSTQRLFERAATTRGLALQLEGPPPGQLMVRGDALRIQQVLSNLISNAIKFSEQGKVILRCTDRVRPGGRRALRFSVTDQGIGIVQALQPQLFEPFVQGGASSGRGGTGLGLAISRRLVTGMGGAIGFRSAPGRGSTFTVDLTLAAAKQAGERPRPGPVAGRPLDLLLAEDNVVNQLLVTSLLKRMGHRVTCAPDGEAALACASERPFDLILMDMQMPRRDGPSTAAAIREGDGPNSGTPILALTADATAERHPLYAQSGIDAVLTKPIDSLALDSALAHWAGGGAYPRPRTAEGTAAPCLDEDVLGQVSAVIGEAALHDLLDLLAVELGSRPRAIRDALADHELERAAGEAHSLKGAAANLGAMAVAEAARLLEQAIAAAGEGDRTRLAPALRSLARAVDETQHALAILPGRQVHFALGAD